MIDLKYFGKLATAIELKSPIKMVDVYSVKELLSIDPNTKVRTVIKSFEQFKNEIREINKWKDKFYSFNVKCDFEPVSNNLSEKVYSFSDKKTVQTIVNEWLTKVEDREIFQLLRKTNVYS